MIISVDTEKAFEKIQRFFHDKNIQQPKNRKKLPQLHKGYLKNPQLKSYLMVKDWRISL